MTTKTSDIVKSKLVELMGQMAQMCAFNRSLGQIYGILYIASEPMSLEDIAKDCLMSKGNASIHLRTLENWGAVQQNSKFGSRKDYYTANTDLRGLAMKRLQEGTSRRLDHASLKIKEIMQEPTFAEYLKKPDGTRWKTRLTEIETLLQQAHTATTLLPKLLELKRFLPL